MSGSAIQPDDFVSAVTPMLQRQDLPGLLEFLKSRWTADEIVELLKSRHCDARKVAALALGLVGGACCLPPLAKQLKDPDPVVNEMAEHALWSIWFRSGCQGANEQICRGAQAMDQRDLKRAVEHFSKAIDLEPKFAEAYNQRAIANYLQEHFDQSIADCYRAVELMPCHFGAWAGMGHCFAHQGRLPEALEAYQKALSINPHLKCLEEACEEIQRQIERE